MNGNEFFELTKKVRAAQKLYFKSRLQGDLMAAKQLERELDVAITRGLYEPVDFIIDTPKTQLELDLLGKLSEEDGNEQ
jgi:hypothetical protein